MLYIINKYMLLHTYVSYINICKLIYILTYVKRNALFKSRKIYKDRPCKPYHKTAGVGILTSDKEDFGNYKKRRRRFYGDNRVRRCNKHMHTHCWRSQTAPLTEQADTGTWQSPHPAQPSALTSLSVS
jgi:hypothetical protein